MTLVRPTDIVIQNKQRCHIKIDITQLISRSFGALNNRVQVLQKIVLLKQTYQLDIRLYL